MSLLDEIKINGIPKHVAIIMDGNGRWAQARNLDRTEGHKAGTDALRRTLEAASIVGIEYMTIYGFSTENWSRPDNEIAALMELIVYSLTKEIETFIENGIRLKIIGDINRLPQNAKKALLDCSKQTANGKKLTLTVALSYSSKWELARAAQNIGLDVQQGKLKAENISEATIEHYLETKGIPDPDLLIRTGGEFRISNFLLWQSAYAELYFTDTFWPDFGEKELYEAIFNYQQRERRFGKTSEQIQSENR